MNKFYKQFGLLAFLLFISSLSFSQTFEVNGINYTSTDGKNVSVIAKSTKYSGNITIPSTVINDGKTYSVTSIGGGFGTQAFQNCTGLTNVVIPNSVTVIGYGAFNGCTGLTNIVIPNSVTSIWGSFQDCSSLTSFEIPNSITSIKSVTFSGCTSLKSVIIPNSIKSIESSAFNNCTSLTSIIIPNSVTEIGKEAFRDCTSLTSFEIPNSVKFIKYNTFKDCTGLTSIVIPNSVTTIGEWSFHNCTNLKSVVIPNSVTTIEKWAFYECTNLESIVIPNSVTSIGEDAFAYSENLKSVTVDITTPLVINKNTFDDGYNATLYVPIGSVDAYKNAIEWKNFTKIEEIKLNSIHTSITSNTTIIKAYNLQGKEVPTNTTGELIIFLYDNGKIEKVFND